MRRKLRKSAKNSQNCLKLALFSTFDANYLDVNFLFRDIDAVIITTFTNSKNIRNLAKM